MWRLPLLNLCFVVILITLVAVRDSVFLFHRGRNSSEDLFFASSPRLPPRAAEPTWNNSFINSAVGGPVGKAIDWWRRSVLLREWVLEYDRPYWQGMHETNRAGIALAEARFHVANAEVLDAVMGDPARAGLELERASAILSDSRPLVMDKQQAKLESIRREVNDAIVDSTTNAANWGRYERIKTDLDHLINTVRLSES